MLPFAPCVDTQPIGRGPDNCVERIMLQAMAIFRLIKMLRDGNRSCNAAFLLGFFNIAAIQARSKQERPVL